MPRGANKMKWGVAAAVALAMLASACSPIYRTHGYTPADEELADSRVGQDTRGSVRRKIGRPYGAGIFTDEGWYYVSQRMEHLTYHEPEVIERKVVAVLFDPNDIVASVNVYGLSDGRIIDLETNTTPTFGQELTILGQAFSNLGVDAGSIFESQ